MAYNSTIKNKHCKCSPDCKLWPTEGNKGYHFSHLPAGIKEQIGNKRKISLRNNVNRTNLKRKVYLAQSKVDMPKTALKRPNKPIPKISKSMAIKLREYAKLKKEFMKEHPICAADFNYCSILATDIHHSKGRVGKLLLDVKYFVPVCRSCHRKIEDNPNMAKELNLSISRLKN